MMETLENLSAFLDTQRSPSKVVVWAHNSHLGDARATEMGRSGEHNVGQLTRQRHGQDALLIGFSTSSGTVTAASDWDEPAERKTVRPGMRGSYEALFHETGIGNFLIDLTQPSDAAEALDTERQSHYFHAHVTRQFDVILHYDRTRAVEPLERTPKWDRGELPETYPTAL